MRESRYLGQFPSRLRRCEESLLRVCVWHLRRLQVNKLLLNLFSLREMRLVRGMELSRRMRAEALARLQSRCPLCVGNDPSHRLFGNRVLHNMYKYHCLHVQRHGEEEQTA